MMQCSLYYYKCCKICSIILIIITTILDSSKNEIKQYIFIYKVYSERSSATII